MTHTVVWWRYSVRHEEMMDDAGLRALWSSWGAGDCSIESIDGSPLREWYDRLDALAGAPA